VKPGFAAMKLYEGTRTPDGCAVTVREGSGQPRPLAKRLDLRCHSATGFEWGYPGSGPAQLALALAADVLGDDDRAQDCYQELKRKVVTPLPREHWSLTGDQLLAAIEAIERAPRRCCDDGYSGPPPL
jgi:hypothetical protein